MPLTPKSRAVLSLIADGLSYAQIVDGHPDITYKDIFEAAEEALRLDGSSKSYHERIEEIKSQYSRAYEKWTDEEKQKLELLNSSGKSLTAIAEELQRQPRAISSQLEKQGSRNKGQ